MLLWSKRMRFRRVFSWSLHIWAYHQTIVFYIEACSCYGCSKKTKRYLIVFPFSLHLFSHHESSASMQLNKRCCIANHLPSPPHYFFCQAAIGWVCSGCNLLTHPSFSFPLTNCVPLKVIHLISTGCQSFACESKTFKLVSGRMKLQL